MKEYEYLNRMYRGSKSIVFIGDSITARFKVGEYFGYRPVLNRGIYSDTTVGLINRIERNCNNLKIYKCFIMIGYNDLKYRRDEEIARNYEIIVKALKADRIYVVSVLPVGRKFGEYAKRIPGLNLRLREIAEGNRSTYVNVYDRLVERGGFIKSEFTFDGVHPNGNGYAEIAKAMGNYINEDRK
jgi:lysophospholipase L1-like esterase